MANNQNNNAWPNGNDTNTFSDKPFPLYTSQNTGGNSAPPGCIPVDTDFQSRSSTVAQPGSYFEPLGANADANDMTDHTHDSHQDYYIRDNFLDQQGQDYANRMEWNDDPQHARAARKRSIRKQIRDPKGHSSKRNHKHHGDGKSKKSSTKP